MRALALVLRRLRNGCARSLLAIFGWGWKPGPTSNVQRIVIIEMTRLGDVIAASALLAPLRRAYPEAGLEWIGQEPYGALFKNEGLTYHALPAGGIAFLKAAWAWRGALRDPALLLVSASPALRHTVLVWLARPGRACGYLFPRASKLLEYDAPAPLQALGGGWKNSAELPKGLHMVQRAALALDVAGIDSHGLTPALAAATQRQPQRVVLHAGANWDRRRWPLERFVQLGGALAQRGFEVELIAAEAGEPGPLAPGLTRVEGLNLSALRDHLAAATLFIGNDSGPLHLAAALGTPCLGLYGPNLVERSGPWPLPGSPDSVHQALYEAVPCRPCDQLRCVQPWDWCMDKLALERVLKVALDMLGV